MDPLIGGALIAGGSSLVGNLLSNSANAKAAEEAGKAARDLWREQAAYNTPANQVARLRAAGLNPNLIYGNGSASTGNISTLPQVFKKEYSYDFAKAIDKAAVYMQMKNLDEQNKNLQEQNYNLREQSKKIAADTKRANIQADVDKLQLDYYRKYGRFPNQSIPSTVTQAVQDLTGLGTHSLESFRHFVFNSLMKPKASQMINKALTEETEPWWKKRSEGSFFKSRF